MDIVKESRCPVVINFVVLDLSVSKFQSCLSYHRPYVGLALLFLKLNPLSYETSKSYLSLYYSVGGYKGRSSVSLSLGDDLHSGRLTLCQNSLSLHLSFCGN